VEDDFDDELEGSDDEEDDEEDEEEEEDEVIPHALSLHFAFSRIRALLRARLMADAHYWLGG